MLEILKKLFDLWCKKCWLKRIDREIDKYIKIEKQLDCQGHVVNALVDEFKRIHGVDLRRPKERKVQQ